MKAAGIVTFGTELIDPDFSTIADAVGLFGARVTKADQLEPALQAAFEHDGPALVEVVIARQELALPPKLTLRPAQGLHALRHPDHTQRPGRRAGRTRQDKPAPARARVSRCLEASDSRAWASRITIS
jgi:Thiamine pyrophosphate enzyme, C-terminal TPP binding domain